MQRGAQKDKNQTSARLDTCSTNNHAKRACSPVDSADSGDQLRSDTPTSFMTRSTFDSSFRSLTLIIAKPASARACRSSSDVHSSSTSDSPFSTDVQAIHAHRHTDGRDQYYVQFAGWKAEQGKWVDAAKLQSPEIVAAYNERRRRLPERERKAPEWLTATASRGPCGCARQPWASAWAARAWLCVGSARLRWGAKRAFSGAWRPKSKENHQN